MSDYFLAPALVTLRAEVDATFPKRDHTSDGWIGDASHAARLSDHNPCWSCGGRSNGIVRAIDIDSNGEPGVRTPLVEAVLSAVVGDPRVWYVIWDGKIYSRTFGWQARVYTGENPHDHHVHVSLNGANGVPADPGNFTTDPWGIEATGDAPPKDKTLPRVSLADVQAAARTPRRQTHPVAVRRVQRALNARINARLEVDGIYGPGTRAAVAAFQRRQGWTGADADGLLGLQSATRLSRGRFRLTR